MTLIRILLLTSILISIQVPASAELLLTGEDLTWNTTTETSPQHTLAIHDSLGTADPLFAWQVGLRIVPGAGSTGTLQFNSATVPTDYLLEGRSAGLVPSIVFPTDEFLTIGDNDSQFTGAAVPTDATPLLANTFDASPDASGKFFIEAVGGEFRSVWVAGDFAARDYGNLARDGSVLVGSITVVPEPSTIVLTLLGASIAGMVAIRRRKK